MLIILDNIRSVYNVGSIFRTADAAGVEKIYLCGITPLPIDTFGRPDKRFIKVSLGAEKTVKWEHVKRTIDLIKKLKKAKSRSELCSATGEGYKIPKPRNAGPGWRRQSRLAIWAVEQDKNSIPYNKSNVKGSLPAGRQELSNVALIFGNEVRGISPAILKKCDKILEIPMRRAMVRQAHHPRHVGRGKESLNVGVAFGIVVYKLLHG